MAFGNPEFLQTKLYSAKALRMMLREIAPQNGVYGPTDLDVTQRAAGGAGMAVDAAPGAAWVAGTTSARQGAYHAYNDAVATLAIGNNASGNPRVDQIILRIYDTTDGAAVQDIAAVEVVPGTGTAGAQITSFGAAGYRAGAGALPASSVVLADVLVANAAGSITNANIVDRRPWARGVFKRSVRTAGNVTTASGTQALVDATNLAPRIECSGAPLRMTFHGTAQNNTAGSLVGLGWLVDGVAPDGHTGAQYLMDIRVANQGYGFTAVYEFVPTAGSHVIGPAWSVSAGTGTIIATAAAPAIFTVEEIVRQNTDNT